MRKAKEELSSQVDVENQRDFYQYYKGRYFGYMGPDGKVLPALISQSVSAPNGYVAFRYYDPTDKLWKEADQPAALKDMGDGRFRFGAPILGTVSFGPTYAYVEGNSLRESIKGIAVTRLKAEVPNGTFIFQKYAAKHPELLKMFGQYPYSVEEAELVLGIFNKSYYTWNESIQLLEMGERLGCPVSKHVGLYLDSDSPDILVGFKNMPGIARLTSTKYGEPSIEINERAKHLKPVLEHILLPITSNQLTIN
jgi:hypothetical protein